MVQNRRAYHSACCDIVGFLHASVCGVQIAWQNGLTDLAMPFMIQFMKDYVGKVDTLMADRKDNIEAIKVELLRLSPYSVVHLLCCASVLPFICSAKLCDGIWMALVHVVGFVCICQHSSSIADIFACQNSASWHDDGLAKGNSSMYSAFFVGCRMLIANRRSSKRKAMRT